VPLDEVSLDRLLARIGLDRRPPADAGGLRAVHRAFVASVPYEALAIQLGETAPLDPGRLVARMLDGGRGGYCFEMNTVLFELLEALGFRVERRQGIVGVRDAAAPGEPTNHLALVVDAGGGERFLADAGLGEGPLLPLPLREGEIRSGPLAWHLERDGDGWWVAQHEWGSVPGFRFADAPSDLAAFAPHHERLSTEPDSSFVQTLVVQQPREDHIVTLRARTLSADGPGRRARDVLPDAAAFAAALRDAFGIDPAVLGDQRLRRLWAQACLQHEAFVARRGGRPGGRCTLEPSRPPGCASDPAPAS
jgi:N-hydroxyarylamine O-acetyltransferase